MISSEDCYPFWITDFKGKEEGDCFYWIITSVYIVTHEKEVHIWGFSNYWEELHEIMELPVDVPADGNGWFYWLDIYFLLEDFFGFFTKFFYLLFCEGFTIKELLYIFIQAATEVCVALHIIDIELTLVAY